MRRLGKGWVALFHHRSGEPSCWVERVAFMRAPSTPGPLRGVDSGVCYMGEKGRLEVAKNILEHLPYMDGRVRRRMTAGLVVTAGVLFVLLTGDNMNDSNILSTSQIIKELVSVPALATLSFALLIYGIGTLVEILSDSIMNRIFVNFTWAHHCYRYGAHRRRFPRGIILIPCRVIIAFCTTKLSFATLDEEVAGFTTRELREDLPEAVVAGICNPFGVFRDAPWRYFTREREDGSVIMLARRLEDRNKDFLVTLTAFVTVLVILYFRDIPSLAGEAIDWLLGLGGVGGADREDNEPGTRSVIYLMFFCVLAFAFVWLFTGISNAYHTFVRNSLLSVTKYRASTTTASRESERQSRLQTPEADSTTSG